MVTIKHFENLEIWQLAKVFCNDIFNLATKYNLHKNYRLFNQIDGSSGFIMDNIDEGFERNGNREFMRYLSIAEASCGEVRSQLYRVLDRNFATTEELKI